MKPINPEVVKAQIAVLIGHYPDLKDDLEAMLASLESETGAMELFDQIGDKFRKAKCNSDAIAIEISDLRARQERYDRMCDAQRKLALKILEIAGLRKVERPFITFGISWGPRKVDIINPAKLTQDFWRTYDPEPDKVKIKNAIKAGIDVPGATLSNGEEFLRVSVK